MYAVTSTPLERRTRATLRRAEFGFFGVVVYTRVQTPRRWGEPFSAGVLVFSTLSSRPLRTSWLIVGMGGLDLLPALGRALDVVLCGSCCLLWCGLPVLLGFPFWPPGTVRPPRSGVSPFPGPADGRRTGIGRPSRLGAAIFRLMARSWSPATRRHQPLATQAHREREQAQGTLGTADHDTRARETGQSRVPHTAAGGRLSPTGADDTPGNHGAPAILPGRSALPWGLPAVGRTLPGDAPHGE